MNGNLYGKLEHSAKQCFAEGITQPQWRIKQIQIMFIMPYFKLAMSLHRSNRELIKLETLSEINYQYEYRN